MTSCGIEASFPLESSIGTEGGLSCDPAAIEDLWSQDSAPRMRPRLMNWFSLPICGAFARRKFVFRSDHRIR